jgi:hypothetical protein
MQPLSPGLVPSLANAAGGLMAAACLLALVGWDEIGIVDLRDITVGKAGYGADVQLPGIICGDRAAAGHGRQARVVRRQRGDEGIRRRKVMKVKGWPWPSKFQPLGGVADRAEYGSRDDAMKPPGR